jgi:anti-sigma regulatory factor (Ser/Thr protein kinase)
MTRTAAEPGLQLGAFVLPSIPASVRIARCHVRAALGLHGLAEYAEDAEVITSELVTNALQHVRSDNAEIIRITLIRTWEPTGIAVIVADSSPQGPARPNLAADNERGRGLQIVDALSAHWGWCEQADGKAVFAVLTQKASAAERSIAAVGNGIHRPGG